MKYIFKRCVCEETILRRKIMNNKKQTRIEFKNDFLKHLERLYLIRVKNLTMNDIKNISLLFSWLSKSSSPSSSTVRFDELRKCEIKYKKQGERSEPKFLRTFRTLWQEN